MDALDTKCWSRLIADSDGDKLPDSAEFPMVGMAFTDPCAGPVLQCNIAADKIFFNGFEDQ